MRKMWLVAAVIAVTLGAAGCRTAAPGQQATAKPWASPGGTPVAPDPKSDACTKVRSAIASRMTALGTAFGQYVGYRGATDGPDEATAAKSIRTEIAAMGTAITDATSAVTDASLRTAAQTAVARLRALTADPDFLADIRALADVPSMIDKLADALEPLADTCG